MRKKNQKEELPGSPGCSGLCRVSSKMKPSRAQGVAPTPYHLLKKVDQNFWIVLRQPLVFREELFTRIS